MGSVSGMENGMATHSSILTWRIPWTEEPGGLQSMGVTKELDMTQQLNDNNNQVCHSISSKEQAYFNFMTTLTVHSDFEAQKIKSGTISIFPPSNCYEVMGLYAMISEF